MALRVCGCAQARESAALRETLQVEREASSTQLEALKTIIETLQCEIRHKPPPCPVISEDEAEEQRRAKEKAAQDILQLQKVHLVARHTTGVGFPCCCGSFSFSSFFKEAETLQREKDSFCKEAERLSTRLLELEKEKEGKVTHLWGFHLQAAA